MKHKEPACTALVLNALVAADDFMNNRQMMLATGCSLNQVTASCHLLRKYSAVDVIIQPDGTGWWFATPKSDQRIRHLEERTPESKPRKTRVTKPRKEKV